MKYNQDQSILKRVENFSNSFIDIIGRVIAVLLLLMVFNVFYDVVMRYFFQNSSVGMQEMEWHLFSAVILFGMGYALKQEAHVRVDFLYEKFTKKTKAYINILGTILFLIPLSLLIIFGSQEFVYDAYTLNEISEDPGGLTHRWIVKSLIPLGFLFLIFSGLVYILKNIIILKELKR